MGDQTDSNASEGRYGIGLNVNLIVCSLAELSNTTEVGERSVSKSDWTSNRTRPSLCDVRLSGKELEWSVASCDVGVGESNEGATAREEASVEVEYSGICHVRNDEGNATSECEIS